MQKIKNNTKSYSLFAILFSITTILFFVLFKLKIISSLDLFLAVIYITYFVGLAIFYNGGYLKEHGNKKSSNLNFIFGVLFVLISFAGLIYGFATGLIELF